MAAFASAAKSGFFGASDFEALHKQASMASLSTQYGGAKMNGLSNYLKFSSAHVNNIFADFTKPGMHTYQRVWSACITFVVVVGVVVGWGWDAHTFLHFGCYAVAVDGFQPHPRVHRRWFPELLHGPATHLALDGWQEEMSGCWPSIHVIN